FAQLGPHRRTGTAGPPRGSGRSVSQTLFCRFAGKLSGSRSAKNRCSAAPLRLHCAMDLEVESQVVCPYCGAVFTTVVDTSSGTFSTIEDCEVCCRPIALNVHCHYGEVESVDFDRA